MGTVVPLSDASRRLRHFPVITALIIVINVAVFVAELMQGDAFVLKWSAVPADIVAGHHWITILTAMFLHGSWSHIIGNMVFLWAFGPEIITTMTSRALGIASLATILSNCPRTHLARTFRFSSRCFAISDKWPSPG